MPVCPTLAGEWFEWPLQAAATTVTLTGTRRFTRM